MAFRRKPMRFIPSKVAMKRHAERVVDMIHRMVRAVALGAIAAAAAMIQGIGAAPRSDDPSNNMQGGTARALIFSPRCYLASMSIIEGRTKAIGVQTSTITPVSGRNIFGKTAEIKLYEKPDHANADLIKSGGKLAAPRALNKKAVQPLSRTAFSWLRWV